MIDRETGDEITLEQALRRDLTSGTLLQFGNRLPSERQMIEMYSTTRVTLRLALQPMEIDGLIYRENRRGWFASGPRLVYDPLQHSNFHRMATDQGRQASTELISASSTTAPDRICDLMGCEHGSSFWCIERRRRIDGRLVLYVQHYLSKTIFPDIMRFDLNRSLSAIYQEEYGISVGSALFEINPIALRGTQAKELRCAEGAYGLEIVRQNRDQNHRIIDCDVETWRHQSISVKIEAVGGMN